MKRVVALGCGLVGSVIARARLGIARFEKCLGLRLSGERSEARIML